VSAYNYTHLHDVFVGATLLWIAVLSILEQDSVHVRAGILEQLVGTVEHDQRDLTVAKYTKFICFLHQSKLPLGERHLHDQEPLPVTNSSLKDHNTFKCVTTLSF